MPSQVQKSWFGFDHYYSDCSFDEALAIVFARHPKTLLDVGGNTGRWATKCVSYDDAVEVTIMDLPQQLEMMRQQTKDLPGAMRIHGYGANLSKRFCHKTGYPSRNAKYFLQNTHIDLYNKSAEEEKIQYHAKNNTTNGKSPDHTVILLIQHQKNRSSA